MSQFGYRLHPGGHVAGYDVGTANTRVFFAALASACLSRTGGAGHLTTNNLYIV